MAMAVQQRRQYKYIDHQYCNIVGILRDVLMDGKDISVQPLCFLLKNILEEGLLDQMSMDIIFSLPAT